MYISCVKFFAWSPSRFLMEMYNCPKRATLLKHVPLNLIFTHSVLKRAKKNCSCMSWNSNTFLFTKSWFCLMPPKYTSKSNWFICTVHCQLLLVSDNYAIFSIVKHFLCYIHTSVSGMYSKLKLSLQPWIQHQVSLGSPTQTPHQIF